MQSEDRFQTWGITFSGHVRNLEKCWERLPAQTWHTSCWCCLSLSPVLPLFCQTLWRVQMDFSLWLPTLFRLSFLSLSEGVDDNTAGWYKVSTVVFNSLKCWYLPRLIKPVLSYFLSLMPLFKEGRTVNSSENREGATAVRKTLNHKKKMQNLW